jgi:cytochrome P450
MGDDVHPVVCGDAVKGRLPGPGTIREQLRVARALQNEPHQALLDLARTYGPVAQIGYGRYTYVLAFGVESNEYVLSTNPTNFRWKEAFWPLVPIDGETALVVSDGADHQRRKAVVLPAFHRRRIAGYLDVMVDQTTITLDGWHSGDTIDAYQTMRETIRRIVLRCLFGDALGEHDDELTRQLHIALAYVNRTPLQRLDNEWLFPPYRKAMQARRAIDVMVTDEITRRRSAANLGDDILGWLLESQRQDSTPLTDQEVRDQVISIIAAAYDTTASAIGWIAARLAEDPQLRASLRTEHDNAVANADILSIDHLPALRHAGAVVNEVLRVCPPALVSVRYIANDFELHGHTVPADRLLMYSSYVTHMDPQQFPDPAEFRPTRWLDGHADHHGHHPYAYVPFGGGSRRCLGFAFALQELTVMTSLMAQLDFEPAYSTPPKPAGIASMAPTGGVPIRIT